MIANSKISVYQQVSAFPSQARFLPVEIRPNETFSVDLSNAVGAILADSQGLGTILDDDSALRTAEAPLTQVDTTQVETELLDALQVQPLLDEAIKRWDAIGSHTAGLTSVDIQIASLPGQMVGRVSGNTIFIDATAAGHGWFIDSSFWDDSEFETPGNQAELNRMDLLTVVMHEVGHLLGLEHTAAADDLMAATLAVGVRALPTPDKVHASLKEDVTGADPTNVVLPFAESLAPGSSGTSAGNVGNRPMPFEIANKSYSVPFMGRQTVESLLRRPDRVRVFGAEVLDRLLDDRNEQLIDDELVDLLARELTRDSA